jgi:hypothetical protein
MLPQVRQTSTRGSPIWKPDQARATFRRPSTIWTRACPTWRAALVRVICSRASMTSNHASVTSRIKYRTPAARSTTFPRTSRTYRACTRPADPGRGRSRAARLDGSGSDHGEGSASTSLTAGNRKRYRKRNGLGHAGRCTRARERPACPRICPGGQDLGAACIDRKCRLDLPVSRDQIGCAPDADQYAARARTCLGRDRGRDGEGQQYGRDGNDDCSFHGFSLYEGVQLLDAATLEGDAGRVVAVWGEPGSLARAIFDALRSLERPMETGARTP